jgi:hypothetical protein
MSFRAIALLVGGLLGWGVHTEASQCVFGKSFEGDAAEADLVVGARVVRHEPPKGTDRPHPAYMDVEVLRVIAGKEERKEVRVWVGARSTDTRLGPSPVGSWALFSLRRMASSGDAPELGWLGFRAGDYTFARCNVTMKELASAAELDGAYVAGLAARLKAKASPGTPAAPR